MCTEYGKPFATALTVCFGSRASHPRAVFQAIKNHAGDLSSTGRDQKKRRSLFRPPPLGCPEARSYLAETAADWVSFCEAFVCGRRVVYLSELRFVNPSGNLFCRSFRSLFIRITVAVYKDCPGSTEPCPHRGRNDVRLMGFWEAC
jgi:hypothetical protein